MRHEITIRSGKPTDLPELQRLNAALFQYEDDHNLYRDDYNLNWPYEAAGIKFFAVCLDDTPDHAAFKTWLIQNRVDRVSVAAYAKNDPALHFYRGLGFTDSALIMEVPLS